jgi:carbamoyl-phosphate synthase small subunit
LIGNYGIPEFNGNSSQGKILQGFESNKIQVRGMIISSCSFNYSHFDAETSLDEWLKQNDIPGMYGIDTRELTKILRTKGVMLGEIMTEETFYQKNSKKKKFYVEDPNALNLAAGVSIKELVIHKPRNKSSKKKILLIDCGVKNNIIRNFLNRGAEVIRVPHNYDPVKSEFDYKGIFISNGPGDPKMCKETIRNIKKSFELNVPIFGICLGSQIMALSAGADTYKLKFGHRSQNQPCIESGGRCYVTSQNHGYAVERKTLPKNWEEWFYNNNDGTNEGIRHKTKPFFAVQFHPESSPGPNDTGWLFDMFMDLI